MSEPYFVTPVSDRFWMREQDGDESCYPDDGDPYNRDPLIGLEATIGDTISVPQDPNSRFPKTADIRSAIDRTSGISYKHSWDSPHHLLWEFECLHGKDDLAVWARIELTVDRNKETTNMVAEGWPEIFIPLIIELTKSCGTLGICYGDHMFPEYLFIKPNSIVDDYRRSGIFN